MEVVEPEDATSEMTIINGEELFDNQLPEEVLKKSPRRRFVLHRDKSGRLTFRMPIKYEHTNFYGWDDAKVVRTEQGRLELFEEDARDVQRPYRYPRRVTPPSSPPVKRPAIVDESDERRAKRKDAEKIQANEDLEKVWRGSADEEFIQEIKQDEYKRIDNESADEAAEKEKEGNYKIVRRTIKFTGETFRSRMRRLFGPGFLNDDAQSDDNEWHSVSYEEDNDGEGVTNDYDDVEEEDDEEDDNEEDEDDEEEKQEESPQKISSDNQENDEEEGNVDLDKSDENEVDEDDVDPDLIESDEEDENEQDIDDNDEVEEEEQGEEEEEEGEEEQGEDEEDDEDEESDLETETETDTPNNAGAEDSDEARRNAEREEMERVETLAAIDREYETRAEHDLQRLPPGLAALLPALPDLIQEYRSLPGQELIHYAAKNGICHILEFVIREQYYEPDHQEDFVGMSPLMVATYHDQFEAVRLLIGFGANVNYRDMLDRCALHFAARNNNPEICELLLHTGAVTWLKDFYLQDAFDYARRTLNSELVDLFADYLDVMDTHKYPVTVSRFELFLSTLGYSNVDEFVAACGTNSSTNQYSYDVSPGIISKSNVAGGTGTSASAISAALAATSAGDAPSPANSSTNGASGNAASQ